ncbi:unnamed protein product [Orchesella dallaii]|uniref:Chromo domain-containing protein n=1 Tax=Orchesella dallaii TaxID=48710 RepID=A0ABP1RYX3_9HEXA
MAKPMAHQDLYAVEALLDKKERGRKIFYLVKWLGYPDKFNSWEPKEYFAHCLQFVNAFDVAFSKRSTNQNVKVKTRAVAVFSNTPTSVKQGQRRKPSKVPRRNVAAGRKVGFEKGLQLEKILGVLKQNGELCFLMKWKGSNMLDVVPAREANLKAPQEVIKFYEGRIKWHYNQTLDEMLIENGEKAGKCKEKCG